MICIHRDATDIGRDEERSLRDAIRDEGCIPTICYGDNFHEDPFAKASYYLHRIATCHPFVEGNKRTAFMTAATIIYYDTEFMIENITEENDIFVRAAASGELNEEEIEKWLRNHVTRSKI
ncbi:MAG: type II toxin-antitoxin system death-on-curing family toxin [Candidatus Methanomethylophilaceae archaeon]